MKKSNLSAFTLAETIMTLFIVGLVVTASIPMFTQKQNSVAQESSQFGTPWGNCEYNSDTNRRLGLCGTQEPLAEGAANATYTENASLVIGGGDKTDGFDLTLNNVPADDTMYDIFQSDNRRFDVGGYRFIENGTNFFILNQDTIPTGLHNVAIGRVTGTNIQNNVLIGNITTQGNIQNNVAIGHTNTTRGNNNILFGSSLTATAAGNVDNNILIGTNINSANSDKLLIGKDVNTGNELNIGDIIYGSNAAGLTFSTNTELTGTLAATSMGLTSDARLKNIKGSYTKGLKEIMQVEPVVFRYKGQSAKNIGVIAQEIQKIFPEAVVKMPDGYLGVNTDPIFFAMLNAMKEVDAKADAEVQRQVKLQKEMENIKAEIESLNACKRDDFWSKIKCFIYDVKQFAKSLIAITKSVEADYEKV